MRKEHCKREHGDVVDALEDVESKLRTTEETQREKQETGRTRDLLRRAQMELRSQAFSSSERERENIGLRREAELQRRTGGGSLEDTPRVEKERMLVQQQVLEKKVSPSMFAADVLAG